MSVNSKSCTSVRRNFTGEVRKNHVANTLARFSKLKSKGFSFLLDYSISTFESVDIAGKDLSPKPAVVRVAVVRVVFCQLTRIPVLQRLL
jgi:hypothetical protein